MKAMRSATITLRLQDGSEFNIGAAKNYSTEDAEEARVAFSKAGSGWFETDTGEVVVLWGDAFNNAYLVIKPDNK